MSFSQKSIDFFLIVILEPIVREILAIDNIVVNQNITVFLL